jgi:putative transposase
MFHTTRQLKIGRCVQFDALAHQAGEVYSQAIVTFWRLWRKHGVWLSKYSMMRLVHNNSLHSQTVQGIVGILYDNIASWRAAKKINPQVKMPKRRKWYFVLPYKASAIKVVDGRLILSNGKKNDTISVPWRFEKPDYVEISFNGEEYVINAVYKSEPAAVPEEGDTAGIDLGEIHLAVAATANKTSIINGRDLRSKRREQNRLKGKFARRMSRLMKGSRKYKQVKRRKNKTLRKLGNQIKDILHKQTTTLVRILKEEGVRTAAIGDIRDLRLNVDYGHKGNQRIHQMVSGQVREMLEYKCESAGIETVIINEAYSSQTCPTCGHRH